MTDSTNFTGVFNAALNIVPLLKNKESEYCLKETDSAMSASAKIFDSFLYGLSEEQYAVLVEGCERSPQRLKEFDLIKSWATQAAEVLDEAINPATLGNYAKQFAEYPDPETVDEDEMVLTLSLALIEMDTAQPYPTAMGELLGDLEPFVLGDAEAGLKALFSPEEKPRTTRRQRPNKITTVTKGKVAVEPVNEKLEALIADTEMTTETAKVLNDTYELGDSVDVPLTDTDETQAALETQVASEAAEKAAEAEAEKAKAKAEKDKIKADKDKAAKAAAATKKKAEAAIKKEETATKKAEAAAQKEEEAAKKLAASGGRRLARTGGGGTGVISMMRRMVIINPDVPFVEVEKVVTSLGIDCKKTTFSPKLSDMRNMLSYLIDMGVIDMDKLNALTTMDQIAAMDEDLSPKDAAKLDVVIASLGAK